MAPNAWNRMESQSIPLGPVHKTLESAISRSSPLLNTIIIIIIIIII